MSIYIPILSEELAEELSRKLYNLLVPDTEKSEISITRYLFNWIKHPTLELIYMEFQSNYFVPINLFAKEDELNEILDPFIKMGIITEKDKQGVMLAISENRGKLSNILDFIPPFWLAQSKNREEMISNGFFIE